MNPRSNLRKVAIIGPGKVGVSVGLLLARAGYEISAIYARDEAKALEPARMFANAKICSAEAAARSADLLLLSVSDDAIEPVCNELADKLAFTNGQLLVHFSGALSSHALSRAREKCAALTASIHPLQTFPSIEQALASLPGAYWFCEGDKRALDLLLPMIVEIGGKPQIIPTEKKTLYHASSVIACNYLVSLMDIALNVAEAASLDPELSWKALQPLVQATLANISSSGCTSSLTGPICRGDLKTVGKHIKELKHLDPELAAIYKCLGNWTGKIAARKGLSVERLDELAGVLAD